MEVQVILFFQLHLVDAPLTLLTDYPFLSYGPEGLLFMLAQDLEWVASYSEGQWFNPELKCS